MLLTTPRITTSHAAVESLKKSHVLKGFCDLCWKKVTVPIVIIDSRLDGEVVEFCDSCFKHMHERNVG